MRLTDGMKTSEFSLTVLALVGVFVLTVLEIDTASFLDVVKFLVPGYAVARGISKVTPKISPSGDYVTAGE